MTEANMDNELAHLPLEIVATYSNPSEAGLAIQILAEAGIKAKADQEAASTWLWHLSVAIGGIHVLVLQPDLEEARRILAEDSSHLAEVQEEVASQQKSEEEPEDSELAKLRNRALRASIFGIIIFPPLLNLYSVYLIFKHQLWAEENGGSEPTFIFTALFNTVSFMFGYALYFPGILDFPLFLE